MGGDITIPPLSSPSFENGNHFYSWFLLSKQLDEYINITTIHIQYNLHIASCYVPLDKAEVNICTCKCTQLLPYKRGSKYWHESDLGTSGHGFNSRRRPNSIVWIWLHRHCSTVAKILLKLKAYCFLAESTRKKWCGY